MLRFAKAAALMTAAIVSCGFDLGFGYGLPAGGVEPVGAAIAMLGPPIRKGYADGDRIYYWRVQSAGGRYVCKIWGAARHNVIVNWGYLDCAF